MTIAVVAIVRRKISRASNSPSSQLELINNQKQDLDYSPDIIPKDSGNKGIFKTSKTYPFSVFKIIIQIFSQRIWENKNLSLDRFEKSALNPFVKSTFKCLYVLLSLKSAFHFNLVDGFRGWQGRIGILMFYKLLSLSF